MDKGHNFYIDRATQFQKKAQKFFSDTNAFMELSYNPFNEILNKVIRLPNPFASTKRILQYQCKQMMPDRTNCELAHLYFNPKTHKVHIVKLFLFFSQLLSIFTSMYIITGLYTSSTD